MATFLFGGANGIDPGAWHAKLRRLRPEFEGAGGFINLSMQGGGPLLALAQAALARAAQPGDLVIWDHADGLVGCVKDSDYDPIEAMRLVEIFLRGCARRKLMVAALLSERFEESRSVALEEVPARLAHLFDRFAVPMVSLTAELRASLSLREIREAHFMPDKVRYAVRPKVREALAEIVSRHSKAIELTKRVPLHRNQLVYPAARGVMRALLPSNASHLRGATEEKVEIGPVATSALTIAPGGSAEFEVEGEILGFAAVLGPEEGVMMISIDSDGFDPLRSMPISLWRDDEATVIGQVSLSNLLRSRINLDFPTRMVVRNVSNDANLGPIRADYGAAPPDKPIPGAPVRLLTLLERRPQQQSAPEPAAETSQKA